MLINGVPVEKYGAKQLTVDFSPSTQETTYEWNAGARLPIMVDHRATFKTVTILLKLKGETRQEVNRNASYLHHLATGEAEYTLDGYKDWVFVGSLKTDPTLKKTVDKHVYKFTLTVTGYMRNREIQREVITRQKQAKIYVDGTRDTPIMIQITPVVDIPAFSIYGVAERGIVIKNLTKNVPIFIDGLTGLVTENEQNKFNDVVMFEFPHLEPGEQTVTFSESICNVEIKYYPMWM